MPMITKLYENISAYVTMGSPPFLRSGGAKLPPVKEG